MSLLPRALHKLRETYATRGIRGVLVKSAAYVKYQLVDKRRRRQFERVLNGRIEIFAARQPVLVAPYSPEDRDELVRSFYPFLHASTPDKLLFESGPTAERLCVVARLDGQIVHYSWAHVGSTNWTTIDVQVDEALIGPCFTLPRARGIGLYPHVLTSLCADLRARGCRRVFIETTDTNMASLSGIRKAGFRPCR